MPFKIILKSIELLWYASPAPGAFKAKNYFANPHHSEIRITDSFGKPLPSAP